MPENNPTTDKKQALLAAAHDVFAAKGYKKVNVADITTSAGMAVGSFYNYFNAKEDIFLAVHIAENKQVRARVVTMVDWDAPADALVGQLFACSMSVVRHNKILSEWNNPAIAPVLRTYYGSDAGKDDNPFHQFLLKKFRERLAGAGYSTAETERILHVYELIYFIDCQPNMTAFPNYEDTFQTLITYFLKGVAIEKTTPRSTKK